MNMKNPAEMWGSLFGRESEFIACYLSHNLRKLDEKFVDIFVLINYPFFDFRQFCLGIYQRADTARPYEVCKS
jgi:hypothetical protein